MIVDCSADEEEVGKIDFAVKKLRRLQRGKSLISYGLNLF